MFVVVEVLGRNSLSRNSVEKRLLSSFDSASILSGPVYDYYTKLEDRSPNKFVTFLSTYNILHGFVCTHGSLLL